MPWGGSVVLAMVPIILYAVRWGLGKGLLAAFAFGVLQFAFDARSDSDYQPHNYCRNCVVYTGTHDNDTTRGWFDNIAPDIRDYAYRYLGAHPDRKGVTFRTYAPSAQQVAVIGEFNGWQEEPMTQPARSGFWEMYAEGAKPVLVGRSGGQPRDGRVEGFVQDEVRREVRPGRRLLAARGPELALNGARGRAAERRNRAARRDETV